MPQIRETGSQGDQTSLARALRAVHAGEVSRRSELTAVLGLTRAATGSVLEALGDLELVHVALPDTPVPGAAGRPSHLVGPHARAPRAVCVHVEANRLHSATAALGGVLHGVTERRLERPSSPASVLAQVADAAAAQYATWEGPCAGLGVALPSAVGDDGKALAAHQLRWPAAVPVQGILVDLLAARGLGALPVQVANDANLAALAEHRHGAGRGSNNLLYLSSGQRGVGGAYVANGQVFTGSHGYALEVGHMTVRPEGRACHCGSAGCMDVECDRLALVLEAHRGTQPPRGLRPAAAARILAAADFDLDAAAAVIEVTRRLGVGLANLVNVFNPDRVVLGGFLAELQVAAAETLADMVSEHSFLDQASRVEVVAGELAQPGLAGAGELAFQRLLDSPREAVDDIRRVGAADLLAK